MAINLKKTTKKTHKRKYNETEVDAAVANIMKTLKLVS